MKIISTLLLIAMCSTSFGQTLFIWPVKKMNSYSDVNDIYITNNYVDQNTSATIFRDWNCGVRSYDGHTGIDIDIWPFTWSMMDNNHVAAIAAADGRVVTVSVNNNNENNCGQAGENLTGNFIAVRHADSSTSFYYHVRNNSAVVSVGEYVTAGQILAFVGSSGRSSNPHLHFEVNRNAVNNPQTAGLIDPYAGNCNSLNGFTSWWLNQKPYREPAIVRVMSHGSRPSLTGYDNNPNPGFCRSAEQKNAKANFSPNDSIYIGVGMRDFQQSAGHSFNVKVYNPNGSVWFDETKNANTEDSRRYYTFDKRLPSNAAAGTYKVEVSFNGTTGLYFFSVNCPPTQDVTGFLFGNVGYKANYITSNAVVVSSNRAFMQAGTQIRFTTGFVAQAGSTLKARINDCNYSE